MRAFFLFSAIFMLQANAYCKELKIVSLSPAVTEMIYQLGAENQLVGRSRVCDYPKQVSSLPIAGDLGTPDIERISKLRADVVISDVNNPAANWEQLRKMGVQIILLRSDSISRYRENIFSIGRVVGKEKNAEQEWNRFDGKMQILKNDSAKVKKVSAAVFLGINPLVSCNDETFIGELLELAGVDNISGKVKKKYFIISPEFILKKNPDIAISTGMNNIPQDGIVAAAPGIADELLDALQV